MWAMWIRDICDCNKDRLTKEEAPTEFQEEESSEDDYVDSEGEEEIIIKRDKSGFYYLY